MEDNNVSIKITAEYDSNEAGAKKEAQKGAEAYNKAFKEAQIKFREQQVNPQGGKYADLGNKINEKFASIKDPFKKLEAKRARQERELSQVDPIIATNRDIQGKGFRQAAALMDADYAKSISAKNSFGATVFDRFKETLQPAHETLQAFKETFDKIESSVKSTNVELQKTREIVSSINGSKVKDLFFKGTDYMALNNSIRAQKSIVDKLKPTENDYTLAAMAMNRGKWSTEAKQRVRDARERIKMYEQELATLKRLEKNEQAPTGGLFSKKFSGLMSKRLGIFSSKNSIFDKKTIAANGLLPTAGYGLLRGGEIALSKLISPLKKVSALWERFTRRLGARLITNAVKAIIRLAKEGLKNLDQYSQHLGTPFHKNVLALSSSLLYLKNAFAAMVGPIVNALTPALEHLMDAFANLANHIGAFFAAVTGQSQFTAALKKTVTTTQQAAGKLKDILGFDEINRLSGETGSGQDVDEMFEEWGEGTIFEQFKQMIESGQWDLLGETLAEKLNSIVDKISTKDLGKKFGEKLGGAIKAARSFVLKLDTKKMGEALATWFNNVLDSINGEDIGELMFGIFQKAVDFLAGLIGNLHWGTVARRIGEMFTGIFNGAAEWIKSIKWNDVGTTLVENIADFIRNIPLGDLITSAFELLKAIVKGAIQLVLGVLKGILNELFPGFEEWFDDLKKKILEWMPDWLKKIFGVDNKNGSFEITGKVEETVKATIDSESKGLLSGIASKLGVGSGESKVSVSVGNDIIDSIKRIMGFTETIKGKTETMSGWGRWFTNRSTVPISGTLRSSGGGSAPTGDNYIISGETPHAASGGSFDKGQLFVANEAGPELIGNLGGKTTVTNQSQFAQGIEDASAGVIAAVMQVVAAVNNKDFDVYMDSKRVGQSVTQYQNSIARRLGY